MKYIVTEVHTLDEYAEGPLHAVIPITPWLVQVLQALRKVVQTAKAFEENFYCVEVFYYGAIFGTLKTLKVDNYEVRQRMPGIKVYEEVDCPVLRINENDFDVNAYIDNTNIQFETASISFTDFEEWIKKGDQDEHSSIPA